MKLLQNKRSIAHYILPIFTIIVFFYSYCTASVDIFPTEGWQTATPEEQGMRSQVLAEMTITWLWNNTVLITTFIVSVYRGRQNRSTWF